LRLNRVSREVVLNGQRLVLTDAEFKLLEALASEPGVVMSRAALSAAMLPSSVSLGSEPFARAIEDFYLSNPVARASRTMAECSALATSLDTAVAAE
jgi:NADH-quinone oxidoreductase subunit G